MGEKKLLGKIFHNCGNGFRGNWVKAKNQIFCLFCGASISKNAYNKKIENAKKAVKKVKKRSVTRPKR